ncbi:MAG TPA: hypothetical protein EYP32_07840, partial [Aquificaceae bacterium]|nr:hypothetical protein [Aquificaceae bacterium]
MKVAFETLGCRMNQFDTDLLKTKFGDKGYEIVPFEDIADVYVINTCTVTVGGDRSSRQAIYQAKRRNPNAIVVATGCYAQVSPEELAKLKEVDIVVGNTHKAELIKILEEFKDEIDIVITDINMAKLNGLDMRIFGIGYLNYPKYRIEANPPAP